MSNSGPVIIHISEVDIGLQTGMGRVEWHWKKAFEERGATFIHIGPSEVGRVKHPGLFPWKAKMYLKQLKVKPTAIIAHEPASGWFTNLGMPCFVESHGVEQRFWELWKLGKIEGEKEPSLKSRLLFPIWRLASANRGLKKAHKLLLLNQEDKTFVQERFKRDSKDIFVFDNGVDLNPTGRQPPTSSSIPTIIFNASWIPRKGTVVFQKAIALLAKVNVPFKLLLIGVGSHVSPHTIRQGFPANLDLQIVTSFKREEECGYLINSDIFVLPSFYEGKPLSLLQAMANGLCCITTDTCGQKDLIHHGQNGFLFQPGDAVQLSHLLQDLLVNSKKRMEAGSAAQVSVKGLDWDTVSNRVVEFILDNLK